MSLRSTLFPSFPRHAVLVRALPGYAAVTLAALALLLAAPARAQVAPPSLTDSLRWDPTVRRGVLPNGIRWFVKKNVKPEDRVSLRLAVPVGSTAEADDQQGIAQLRHGVEEAKQRRFDPLGRRAEVRVTRHDEPLDRHRTKIGAPPREAP